MEPGSTLENQPGYSKALDQQTFRSVIRRAVAIPFVLVTVFAAFMLWQLASRINDAAWVLMALYENKTPFTGHIVDLANPNSRVKFIDIWPVGKMPVLRDESLGQTIPETSIIIEYLDQHYPGAHPLLPADENERLDARLWDRFVDLYVQVPMQKIVADRLRSDDEHDPRGVADATATLKTAYDMIDRHIADRTWVAGENLSIADCAAAPALFYAGIVVPFADTHPNVVAYFERLLERPSFKRVLAEARPYFQFFPFKDSMPARFLNGNS